MFLQAASALPPPEQGFEQTFMMLAVALLFFYFILWRPEQKKRKKMDEMRSQLKRGDRVMVAGIFGEVAKIQTDTVILKMIDGAKMEVLKEAIIEVSSKSPDKASDKKEEAEEG